MKTENRSISIIPFLAVYVAAAVFLLPGSDSVLIGQEEQETVIDKSRIASYDIQVTLTPDTKSLSGRETITWINDGGKATKKLVLHLPPNDLAAGDCISPADEATCMEIKSIGLADGIDLSRGVSIDGSLLHVELPEEVLPGGRIRLEVDFTVILPEITERIGYSGNYFMAGHWFPKMAVYLDGNWIASKSQHNSDLFSDYGHFRVEITVPKSYEVAATGRRLKARTDPNTKTLIYSAHPVHDFAWVASTHFRRSKKDFSYSENGEEKKLEVHLLMQRDHIQMVDQYFDIVSRNLENFTAMYGPYPYSKLVIVDPAPGKGLINSGQNFPMLTTAGSSWLDNNILTGDDPLNRVVSRVFADQYWNAAIGSDQFREAWLTEGIAAYTSNKVVDSFGPFRKNTKFPKVYSDYFSILHPFRWAFDFNYWDLTSLLKSGLETSTLSESRNGYLKSPAFDPVSVTADKQYNSESRRISSLIKPDLAFRSLEQIVGKDTVTRVLSRYYQSFRFRMATGQELEALFSEISGQNLDWYFDQVFNSNKVLDYTVSSVDKSKVTCERLGEVILPQTLRIFLEDGNSFDIFWALPEENSQVWMSNFVRARGLENVSYRIREGLNGKWLKVEVKAEAGVKAAQIDPDFGYSLDINFANNSFAIAEDRAFADRAELSWVRILSRWFHGISSYN